MCWVFIPADTNKDVIIYNCTDTIEPVLKETNDALPLLSFTTTEIADDIAFVAQKNATTLNLRAICLAKETDEEYGTNNDLCGNIAVVMPCNTLYSGYAELQWHECEDIAKFFQSDYLVV